MAYDRYDSRRDRNYPRGDRDERGFFERAGDEVASWFDGDNRDQHRYRERNERDWFGGNRDRERDYGRDRFEDDNRSYRPMNWTSSDRDYRSGYDYDRGYGGRTGYDRDYRPLAGDYGRSGRGGYDRSESPWGRDDYRRTGYAGSTRDDERHYAAWRDREMSDLDRDYDEYRRECQQRFENDFGAWREKREEKRQLSGQIREHMDVVGRDGEKIGRVDCVRGDRIVLTKSDSPDDRHHSIPCSTIDTVEKDQVRLECTADEAKRNWRDEDERGFLERKDHPGPSLERSFSGTYR